MYARLRIKAGTPGSENSSIMTYEPSNKSNMKITRRCFSLGMVYMSSKSAYKLANIVLDVAISTFF